MPRKPRKPVLRLGPITVRALSGSPGAWRWRAEWYPRGHEGRMVTRSLSRKRGERFDRDEAMSRAAELLSSGAHLTPTERAGRAERRRIETVRDLLELWAGHQRERVGSDIAPRTFAAYRGSCLRLVAVDTFASAPLVSVGQREVRQAIAVLKARYAGRTAEVTYRTLRLAWSWGAERRFCTELPRIRVTWAARAQRMPTLDEVSLTVDAMRAHHRQARCAEALQALPVLLGTACRPGELALARVEDFNLRARVWIVAPGTSKTGSRTVPLNDSAVAALRETISERQAGPLWAPPVGRAYSQWARWIARGCDEAGVEHWTPKGLRHLGVTRMLGAGVDVATIASITGHSVQVLLSTYAHVIERRRHEAVATLSTDSNVLPFPLKERGGA